MKTRTKVFFFPFDRPDISAIRDRAALTGPNANQLTAMQFQPPALEDLEAPRRQTSLDGEAIKIIIHDVDSGPFLASKRRVTLRRDPTDKAHRSNEFAIIQFHFISFVSISIGNELSNLHTTERACDSRMRRIHSIADVVPHHNNTQKRIAF